jgi:hypothetical protein
MWKIRKETKKKSTWIGGTKRWSSEKTRLTNSQLNEQKKGSRPKSVKLEKKKGILPQVPLRSRGSLGNILKTESNKLENLE